MLLLLGLIPPRLEEYDALVTGQPIWRERLQGVGVITRRSGGASRRPAPILRSHRRRVGHRRGMPYLLRLEVEFDVIVGSYGGLRRYAIRLNEVASR